MSTIAGSAPPLPISLRAGLGAWPEENSWLYSLLQPRRLARRWARRRWQRIALRELAGAQHQLNDLGLTRSQALREAGKPFWRP